MSGDPNGLTGPPAGVAGAPVLRRATDACYLLAVVAINFTLFRPSPVDILFVLALVLSLASGQVITRNIFIFVSLMGAWTLSMCVSSLPLLSNPEVGYYLGKISFAVSIGLCSALVAAHWRTEHLDRFLRVYVFAACAAATLGTAGYLSGIEDLTWDGRAKGLLDDPNMYGAFLLPGLIACMDRLVRGSDRLLYGAAMGLLLVGLTLSFSRAAIMSFLVWGGAYYLFANRAALPRAAAHLVAAAALVAIGVAVASMAVDGFSDRLADRSTIAKEYDLGQGGRYNRYALSIGFILDNPLGLGLLEWDRFYDEPIHNIWVSSFLNYGWIAGVAFTLLLMFTVAVSASNYLASRNTLFVVVAAAWAAVICCAFLHEAERWRHLWLMTGLLWGLNARHLAAAVPSPVDRIAHRLRRPGGVAPPHGEPRPA